MLLRWRRENDSWETNFLKSKTMLILRKLFHSDFSCTKLLFAKLLTNLSSFFCRHCIELRFVFGRSCGYNKGMKVWEFDWRKIVCWIFKYLLKCCLYQGSLIIPNSFVVKTLSSFYPLDIVKKNNFLWKEETLIKESASLSTTSYLKIYLLHFFVFLCFKSGFCNASINYQCLVLETLFWGQRIQLRGET